MSNRQFSPAMVAVWLVLIGFIGIALASYRATVDSPKVHVLTVALPVPADLDHDSVLSPLTNRLRLDRNGALYWNAEPIDRDTLRSILSQARQEEPPAVLLFAPDPDASYGDAANLLHMVWRYGLVDRCFRFADISPHRHLTGEAIEGPILHESRTCGVPTR